MSHVIEIHKPVTFSHAIFGICIKQTLHSFIQEDMQSNNCHFENLVHGDGALILVSRGVFYCFQNEISVTTVVDSLILGIYKSLFTNCLSK